MKHEHENSRLRRRIEALRACDLSSMGYEARARHEQQLRDLEQRHEGLVGTHEPGVVVPKVAGPKVEELIG